MKTVKQEIIDIVKGKSPTYPIIGNRIAELTGKTKRQIKAHLSDLHRCRAIGRTDSIPYSYYDAKFDRGDVEYGPEEVDGKMKCAMKNGKEVVRKEVGTCCTGEECVVNPEAPECNVCRWGVK